MAACLFCQKTQREAFFFFFLRKWQKLSTARCWEKKSKMAAVVGRWRSSDREGGKRKKDKKEIKIFTNRQCFVRIVNIYENASVRVGKASLPYLCGSGSCPASWLAAEEGGEPACCFWCSACLADGGKRGNGGRLLTEEPWSQGDLGQAISPLLSGREGGDLVEWKSRAEGDVDEVIGCRGEGSKNVPAADY